MSKKDGTKKKHGFLKFLKGLLITVGVFAGTVAVVVLIGHFGKKNAEKILAEAEPSIPTFTDPEDSMQHVTADFYLPLTIANREGKEHKVSWKVKSSYADLEEDGLVRVTAPKKNQQLTLTETYRWLLFKASRTYSVILATDKTQTYDEEDTVPVSQILDGTYTKQMDLGMDSDGNVKFLYGNFGGATVYNEEDAKAYVEQSRNALGIPEGTELKSAGNTSSKSMTLYNFSLYRDGAKVDGDRIMLTVNNSSFEPVKITCDIRKDFDNLTEADNLSASEYEDIVRKHYEKDSLDVEDVEPIICENSICERLDVSIDGVVLASVLVDRESGEIVRENTGESQQVTETLLGGVAEDGKKLWFNGVKDENGFYIMYDPKRNIKVFRIDGDTETEAQKKLQPKFGEHWPEDDSPWELSDPKGNNRVVVSKSMDFEECFAVESECFDTVCSMYDYYYDTFGIKAYDNHGSRMNIYTNANQNAVVGLIPIGEPSYDNAGWHSGVRSMWVSEQQFNQYTVAVDPSVLAHEYTHAVFGEITGINGTGGGPASREFSSLNEAYADILGILGTNPNSWMIGLNLVNIPLAEKEHPDLYWRYGPSYYLRDDTTLELYGWQTMENERAFDKYLPEEMFDPTMDYDPHLIGKLISNVAYEMYQSGYYTADELAQIWFDSMMLGYNPQTATFYDVRSNVMQAMDNLGYGTLEKDSVAYFFDEKGIRDYDYVIESEEYKSPEKVIIVIRSIGEVVDGDPVLDDKVRNSYFAMYMPMESFLPEAKLYIFEVPGAEDAYDGLTDEQIEEKIEEVVNKKSILAHDKRKLYEDYTREFLEIFDRESPEESTINVEYTRVSPETMSWLRTIASSENSDLREQWLESFENEEEAARAAELMECICDFYITDSTAYDFYYSL